MYWPVWIAMLLLMTPVFAPNRKWLALSFICFLALSGLIWRDLHQTFASCRETGNDSCDWAGWDMMLWSGWAILYMCILVFRIMLEVIWRLSNSSHDSQAP